MTDSIYDQLNAYGTVAKQRFVDNFSGSVLDTDRWSTHGSGTIAMDNSIDGGLKITSATTGVTRLDFSPSNAGKIRPFSGSGSVMITVAKLTQVLYGIMTHTKLQDMYYTEVGDYASISTYGDLNGLSSSQKKFKFNSSEFTNVDLTIAESQLYLWHTYKLELKSASTEASVDGVLEGTGGASIVANVQPACETSASEGSANSVGNIRYMECYNT